MTDSPKRVQRKRTRGFRLAPETKCVTRETMFGNPFCVGQVWEGKPITAEISVRLFNLWMTDAFKAKARHYLRGWNLACYCDIGAPCHGDSLLKVANE